MSSSSSRVTVYSAIAANAGIAIAKFVAAAATGSSAMASEGIHSLVDMGDGLLLLLGMHMASRPPDREHPFGHGPELYFWAFVVAVLIFAVGGGMSVYEGIGHLGSGHTVEDPLWNYVILGIAAVFEGVSWLFALRGFLAMKRQRRLWSVIRDTKDPTTLAVLFEDSAALVGIAIAFAGIAAGQVFGTPVSEAIASILIGLLLAGVAWILAVETKGLLIGEAAVPETVASIQRIAEQDPAVARAGRPLTLHLGPDQLLVHVIVEFRDDLGSPDIKAAARRIRTAVRERHPEARYVTFGTLVTDDP